MPAAIPISIRRFPVRLVILSSKICWLAPGAERTYKTKGGFPFQVQAISELFQSTELVVPVRAGSPPSTTEPLRGQNLSIRELDEPAGHGWWRKAGLLIWSVRNLPRMWRAVRDAGAVHVPVPGDVGFLGILLALVHRKRLIVRHCGTWGNRRTFADVLLFWLLERIAGPRNIVLATGGGIEAPSRRNPRIGWIFSSALTRSQLAVLPTKEPWKPGSVIRLVTAARQEPTKNTACVVQALSLLRKSNVRVSLDVAGDGSYLPRLRELAQELGLESDVTFHGHLPHRKVLKLLQECDIFCFPTMHREGFPKAVVEALACGLPAVTTPVSVLPHLIEAGNGIILRDTEPQTLAQAVMRLTEDPNQFAAMVKNAQETARDYSVERWQAEISQILAVNWDSLDRVELAPAA